MHCLRLYLECIELMREARITLPRPERDMLIRVRQGSLTLAEFTAQATRLRTEAEMAATQSHLPDQTNPEAISALVAQTTLAFWSHTPPR
jgi:hypothetical protein